MRLKDWELFSRLCLEEPLLLHRGEEALGEGEHRQPGCRLTGAERDQLVHGLLTRPELLLHLLDPDTLGKVVKPTIARWKLRRIPPSLFMRSSRVLGGQGEEAFGCASWGGWGELLLG